MAIVHSPLRYPGGKQVLSRLIAHLIKLNNSAGGTYVEPYAGGASIALSLIFGEHVERVVINDADPCIFAFWRGVLHDTEKFVKLLRETPTTVEEWVVQRDIYLHPKRHSQLRLGFATFYLNRCNRSGIIARGGPIGGRAQEGEWKVDARYNRDELERRIRRISMYRDRIDISNRDAIDLIDHEVRPHIKTRRPFVYLDPPYYAKGPDLYLNYYDHNDHKALADYMKKMTEFPWIMSYDNVPEIVALYKGLRQVRFSLDYSARERREGSEIMILRNELIFPSAWAKSIPRRFVTAADDAPRLPVL
jgi:DNA adenine methylase